MKRVLLGLRVAFLFFHVEWLLRRSTLPATCERLGIAFDGDPSPGQWPAPARVALLRRHDRAVGLISQRWPLGDTCLRRCLVLGTLSRDVEPRLVLGVRAGGGAGARAHSWLEIAGVSIDATSSSWVPLTA